MRLCCYGRARQKWRRLMKLGLVDWNKRNSSAAQPLRISIDTRSNSPLAFRSTSTVFVNKIWSYTFIWKHVGISPWEIPIWNKICHQCQHSTRKYWSRSKYASRDLIRWWKKCSRSWKNKFKLWPKLKTKWWKSCAWPWTPELPFCRTGVGLAYAVSD